MLEQTCRKVVATRKKGAKGRMIVDWLTNWAWHRDKRHLDGRLGCPGTIFVSGVTNFVLYLH